MPIIKARTNRVKSIRNVCLFARAESRQARGLRPVHRRHADDVLNQLIEITITKDREFLAWRAERIADGAEAATRRASGRPRESTVARQARGRWLCARSSSIASCGVSR